MEHRKYNIGDPSRRISGYDPATGVCWQFSPGPACSAPERNDVWFGWCRDKRQWFWVAHDFAREVGEEGRMDTEDAAITAVLAAVCRLAAARRLQVPGNPTIACYRRGWASMVCPEAAGTASSSKQSGKLKAIAAEMEDAEREHEK
jgi:hypothetical protein